MLTGQYSVRMDIVLYSWSSEKTMNFGFYLSSIESDCDRRPIVHKPVSEFQYSGLEIKQCNITTYLQSYRLEDARIEYRGLL